jgi:hypothetical protein
MRDAVDLIGKKIVVRDKTYTISKVNFLPQPARPGSYIWFGLSSEGSTVNYDYNDLLPYLKEQIKL